MVFTVTAGTARTRAIRRFTVAGDNIFPDAYGSTTFRDIDVSDTGLVVAVDADGLIYEYDVKGMLLFVFGAKDRGEQRLGTLRNPTAIAYHDKDLYVLDKDKNAIVIYRATRFATLVHEGVRLYTEGFYREAKPYFEQVLKYNGAYRMAYQAIADAYFKEGDYAQAFVNYRYAEDRNGYSEAFWELRNNLLQRYLGSAILAMIGLGVVQSALARVDRRYGWFAPVRNGVRALARVRLVDDFVFMFRFIKQPADSFYYIKQKLRGSLTFAFLLYAWVIASRVLALYLTGFIFNRYPVPSAIRPQNEILYSALLIVLWNSANYLVSTISDGEGRVRDVIIGTAYSLFPYALFTLPIALLSNVLTLNEVFIYTFSIRLVDAWVALMLFLMVKEIHNYSVSETIRNILYTVFTMAVMLLTGYILYVLFNQLFDFVVTISREVRLRG
jgi:tetratricopeptide (TPR) repeat protein